MFRRFVPLVLLLAAVPGLSRGKTENWVEVRSEHFLVATNSSEKQGRRIADQFERMRVMFHLRFPKLQIDPPAPIIVLAIKDEKDFRALEPEAYLAKGQARLGGLFLRAPDKNYVLMRVDAEGEHPYEVVYHEYTHLLLGKSAEWIPLWLNEGLAEFYEKTDIRENQALIGQPSNQNLQLLRHENLLPLSTLFTVDVKSPYYHEEKKTSIFYAESWALTHMILIADVQQKTQKLTEYVELLAKNVEPVEAATRAFGDLRQLETALRSYVQQERFAAIEMNADMLIDSAFKSRAMAPAQSEALRADFLACNQRFGDSRALLDQVLKDDPANTSARETMGFLEFRQGHLDEALKWYSEAVRLDSQSFLAQYNFAMISMARPVAAGEEAKVEASLRAAIKLNPSFAPTYDRMAVFLATHNRDMQEAHLMGLQAVSLDPENVGYRINIANVFLQLHQTKNAVNVLRAAAKIAKTPEDIQAVDNFLMHAQEYDMEEDQRAEQQHRFVQEIKLQQAQSGSEGSSSDVAVPTLKRRDNFVPKGPHLFLVGVLKGVHCDAPQMDLTLQAGGKSLPLRVENYFKLPFTALNFTPSGDLDPCKDLEGRPAKVEYVESSDRSIPAHVISVELHK